MTHITELFHNIVDNHGRLMNEGPLLGSARGIYGKDAFAVHKFGFNPNQVNSLATVWDGGGLYPWQTIAEVVSVVSDDADDAFGGIGAQTIKILGLDWNWNLADEIVEMDGLTPVITKTRFLRIYRALVPPLEDVDGNPVAGQGDAAGTISFTQGAAVRAQIVSGNNQTLMSIYTVPAGYTGFMMHGSAGVGSGKEATVKYFVRPYLGVFNLGYIVQLFENNEQRPFVIPQRIDEKTDIDVRAISESTSGIGVSSNFDIALVRNPS